MGAKDQYEADTNGSGTGTGGLPTGAYVPPSTVFMGYTSPSEMNSAYLSGKTVQDENTMGLDQAKAYWYQMSDPARAALGQNLYRAGVISDSTDFEKIQAAWNAAVVDAAMFNQAGRHVTPWEVLNMKIGLSGPNVPKGQKSISYHTPSKQDAATSIKAIFLDALGRNPTKDEVDKYATMMVGMAKNSPDVSTTTLDAAGNQVTTSTPGVSQGAMNSSVLDQVQTSKEYGAYQAATTYYNAVLKAFASPVNPGG